MPGESYPIRLYRFDGLFKMTSPRIRGLRAASQYDLDAADTFAKVFGILAVRHGQKIVDRLWYLLRLSRKQIMDHAPMSFGSLKRTAIFLSMCEDLKMPGVVLTADGYIQLEWFRSRERRAVVQMVPSGDLVFTVRSADSRYSGLAKEVGVIKVLENENVKGWFDDVPH